MCGIVGYCAEEFGPSLLGPLLSCMRNRGPDGEGQFHDRDVHMGMRRLAVVDIEGGNQPLVSREGRVVAFQNGEIYNHAELRKVLESAGYRFRSSGDTEVLAHGYAAWGIDGLLSRIDGMFALAIYDSDTRVLHLARDRYGEKPLFYCFKNNCLGYSSTLLAASAFPWVSDALDPTAMDWYLALHFVPGDRTVLSEVRQVLPGQRLEYDIDAHVLVHHAYFNADLPKPRKIDDTELARTIESAVVSRMMADVPLGVFLSGGLDSSLVAAIAAKKNSQLATFSIGFRGSELDESPYAAATAKHIGSRHHEFQFDVGAFNELLPQAAAELDTPIGDQATLPLFWLSREARKHVTVVLSGEGADEVFGGYGYYRKFAAASAAGAGKGFLSKVFSSRRMQSSPASRIMDDDPPETLSGFPLLTRRQERAALVVDCAEAEPEEWETQTLRILNGAHNPLQRATAADIATWLPSDLLVKLDRMSMAHSLEARAPFLCPKVVDQGLALSPAERMGKDSKVALRRVAAAYLPDHIVNRGKQGFVLPMAQWLSGWFEFCGGAGAYFQARPAPGLDQTTLHKIVELDLQSGVQRQRLLFAIILLCEWWNAFNTKRALIQAQIRSNS